MAKKKPGSPGGKKRKRVTSRVVNPQNPPASPPAQGGGQTRRQRRRQTDQEEAARRQREEDDQIVLQPSQIANPPQPPQPPPLSLLKWLKMLDWAWLIVSVLWLAGAGLIVLGIMPPQLIWKIGFTVIGLLLVLLGFVMFFMSLRTITTNPPHKGILTVWGERLPKIKDEGDRFLPDYFPFNRSVIEINVTTTNKDIMVMNIAANRRAKGGLLDIPTRNGELVFEPEVLLKAEISTTYEPDVDHDRPHRLIEYHQIGSADGVFDNINDKGLVGDFLRSLGTINRARVLMSSKSYIKLYLIKYLTGKFPGEGGMPGSLDAPQDFLNLMRDKGFPDAHRLGIVLKRIDINEFYFQNADVQKAVDQVTIEEFERQSEIADIETGIKLAERYYDMDDQEQMTAREAIDRAQADRGRNQRVSLSIDGLGSDGGTSATALLTALQQLGVKVQKQGT